MEGSTIFANFTEEYCTGTGDTLALAGITDKMIPFNKSFSDGQPVAYTLKDSGGIIKISGVGTYVAATDDITRNDKWSWNGTVVDNNPSNNIALSSGTHTISCDTTKKNIAAVDRGLDSGGKNYIPPAGAFCNGPADSLVLSSSLIYITKTLLPAGIEIDALRYELINGVDLSTAKMGFAEIGPDNTIGDSIAETAAFNTTSAEVGINAVALTSNYKVNESKWVYLWVSTTDAITIRTYARSQLAVPAGMITQCDNRGFGYWVLTGSTASAPDYPATPPTITGNSGAEALAIFVRYL